MGKTAYFDLFAGCSGDMILGALLDAGLPLPELQKELGKLPLKGYRVTAEKVRRGAVTATRAQVVPDGKTRQPDRSYSDIVALLEGSKLDDSVKKRAIDIFNSLGEAEAKIHGVRLEQVHFHEVGAVDSIVDIVGAVIGFNLLGITDYYSSPFPVAGGSVACRHGGLPLPAPATLELLTQKHAPVTGPCHTAMEGQELVTPTGAAIVATMCGFTRPPLNLEKIGYGAGSRDPGEYPNVMRIWIGESPAQHGHEGMVLLETNIDDMNPQIYDYVMERLFEQGALDVWFTHIQMKKNRPAVMLSVLAAGDAESRLAETIMRETSTLGIRVRPVFRHIAGRESIEIDSTYGKVRVKVKRFQDEVLSISPEYDECRRIASQRNIPLRDVYRMVEAEARERIK
jgi:pyridinium-3,5-bisthiocarboxylic acid mononucleotide nickel chelatase